MQSIKDTSTRFRTQLETTVKVGRQRAKVAVSIPGRDVWAYQMAKIQLQERTLQVQQSLRDRQHSGRTSASL